MNVTASPKEEDWTGPLCDSLAWKAGYREGRGGRDLPKRRKGSDANWQRCLSGYQAGRLFYALELWCKKHDRTSVHGDPKPMPEDDPYPWDQSDVERWLAMNRDLHIRHRRKVKKKRI